MGTTAPKEKYLTEEESGVFGLNVFCKKDVVRLAYAGVSNVRANMVCVRIVEERDVAPPVLPIRSFALLSFFASVAFAVFSPVDGMAFVLDFEAMDFFGDIRPSPR